MTVLVTGASGFVGLALVHHLQRAGRPVLGLADRPPPSVWWPDGAPFVAADIRDGAALEEALRGHGVKAIVHAAAVTPGPAMERADPERIVSINVGGAAAIVAAAARAGVRRVVLASSVAVYPLVEPADGAFDAARDAPGPGALYGVTKIAAEQVAARIAAVHGLTLPILRLGAVYGAFEHDTGVRETLSAQAQILAAATAGGAVRLPREGHGAWLNVRDAAGGLAALVDAEVDGAPIFDLGGPESFSIVDFCAAIARRRAGFVWSIDADNPTIRYQLPVDRAPSDGRRLAETTGFIPRFGLEAGLDDALSFFDGASGA